MIEFKNVNIQHISDFFSLYNCNLKIQNHTLLIENEMLSAMSIFRILSKIDKHYSGTVEVDKINLKGIKNKDLNIAYIPQSPVLFKNKDIYKNLEFSLKIRKIDKKTRKKIINSIILEFDLDKFNKNIKKLSLSEQKIVSLLRAYIREPKYVLFENFFDNFDDKYFGLAQNIIEKLKQTSTIIACEKEKTNVKYFNNFEIINLQKE